MITKVAENIHNKISQNLLNICDSKLAHAHYCHHTWFWAALSYSARCFIEIHKKTDNMPIVKAHDLLGNRTINISYQSHVMLHAIRRSNGSLNWHTASRTCLPPFLIKNSNGLQRQYILAHQWQSLHVSGHHKLAFESIKSYLTLGFLSFLSLRGWLMSLFM